MEETGKVDLSILDSLSKLRSLLKIIKTKWLEIPNSDGFYFYQAARNVELILGTMQYRFEHSQEANDNPKIAEDSLVLLPAIDKILEVTQSYKITENSINEVLQKTHYLRNQAASTKLIENLDISRDSIDKDQLKLQFSALMQNLDSTY